MDNGLKAGKNPVRRRGMRIWLLAAVALAVAGLWGCHAGEKGMDRIASRETDEAKPAAREDGRDQGGGLDGDRERGEEDGPDTSRPSHGTAGWHPSGTGHGTAPWYASDSRQGFGGAGGQEEDPALRLLTKEELQRFEEYLNQSDNYGFLLSDYQTPDYLDLNEVFYCGAGIGGPAMTGEEVEAFLRASGQGGIDTDMVSLDAREIDAFLLKKTGLNLKQMKNGLDWAYLPEYGRYYKEHGDTNIRSFFCPKGEAEGGVYRIWCLSDRYTSFNLESIVSLKKTGSGYQFLSNEFIWDHHGLHKEGVSEPTPEALHSITSAYKKESEWGAAGEYPAGRYPVDYGSSIFDSDTRYYSREEMQRICWTPGLAAIYRNEIYARHGYRFKNDLWNGFFRSFTWYSGMYPADGFDTDVFNGYEKANLKLAVELEQ